MRSNRTDSVGSNVRYEYRRMTMRQSSAIHKMNNKTINKMRNAKRVGDASIAHCPWKKFNTNFDSLRNGGFF